MFAFLAIVLVLALLRYGGVQPESSFGIGLLFALGFCVLAIFDMRSGRRFDGRFMILAAVCAALAVFVDVKLALGPMAGVGAWFAVTRRPGSLVRFFHVLLVIGVLESLLGLFQYFVAPGWILGYVNEAYATSGTLINRNHFAGLLGMLIPVAIGLAYVSWVRHRDPGRTYLYLLTGSVMGLALIFSLSRMGILSLALTLGVMAVLIRWAHSAKLGSVLALVPVVLVLIGAVWIGADVIVERFERLVGSEGTIEDTRVGVFRDTLRMISEHPLGIGVGAYEDVFRRYQTTDNHLLFDHAHNDYLETTAEWGIPTAALFWIWILSVLGIALRAFVRSSSPEHRGILLVAIGAVCSMLTHSFADFNLQIPSNAMLFAMFIGTAVAAAKQAGQVASVGQSTRAPEAERL